MNHMVTRHAKASCTPFTNSSKSTLPVLQCCCCFVFSDTVLLMVASSAWLTRWVVDGKDAITCPQLDTYIHESSNAGLLVHLYSGEKPPGAEKVQAEKHAKASSECMGMLLTGLAAAIPLVAMVALAIRRGKWDSHWR
jgi:hypothetical protein